MKLFIQILLLLSFAFGYSQTTINKNIKTVAACIRFGGSDKNPKLESMDVIKDDTIKLSMFKIGLEGYSLNLFMDGNNVMPKLSKYSDYGEFDGKSSIELNILDYKLEVNKKAYVAGDTIMGGGMIKTVPHKYQEKMIVKGTIFHIIGGNSFTWISGKSTHNKYFQNGKNVFVKKED